MAKKMKRVRIVKSESTVSWYANKIGEIITVEVPEDEFGMEKENYIAVDSKEGTIAFINKGDVEDVEDDISKAQLQTLIIELSKTVAGLRSDLDALSSNMFEVDYKAGQALTSTAKTGAELGILRDTQFDWADKIESVVRRLDARTQSKVGEITIDKCSDDVVNDAVNQPSHYTQGDIEVIDFIDQVTEGYIGKESYYIGNVIKYISRAPHKNNCAEDLRKARWYLDRLIGDTEAGADE